MPKKAWLWILPAVLVSSGLGAQVPASERIPVTDPDRLAQLGYPPDARNVFVWSRARVGDALKETSGPETWGTELGYSSVSGYQLWERNEDLHIQRTTQSCWCSSGSFFDGNYALAQFQVPEGALLERFRFWAWDFVDDQDLTFRVWETCQGVGFSDEPSDTLILEASTIGAIGNYNGLLTLDGPTVNNRLCTYSVQVEFAPEGQSCDPDLAVRKLQLAWTRQVSPPPATATFNDVPTNHPFFQFVEALAKSGITAGCSVTPPLFCPDQPLTRGQMAAFLAKGLGLQWP